MMKAVLHSFPKDWITNISGVSYMTEIIAMKTLTVIFISGPNIHAKSG